MTTHQIKTIEPKHTRFKAKTLQSQQFQSRDSNPEGVFVAFSIQASLLAGSIWGVLRTHFLRSATRCLLNNSTFHLLWCYVGVFVLMSSPRRAVLWSLHKPTSQLCLQSLFTSSARLQRRSRGVAGALLPPAGQTDPRCHEGLLFWI